jgi:hypothetical protein
MGDSVQVMAGGESSTGSDQFCDVLLAKNMDKTASSPDSAIG